MLHGTDRTTASRLHCKRLTWYFVHANLVTQAFLSRSLRTPMAQREGKIFGCSLLIVHVWQSQYTLSTFSWKVPGRSDLKGLPFTSAYGNYLALPKSWPNGNITFSSSKKKKCSPMNSPVPLLWDKENMQQWINVVSDRWIKIRHCYRHWAINLIYQRS